MELLRKYGVQTDIYFPLIDAGTVNFAVSGDYTHASGDVKISKDGGAAATATNSPSAITMGAGAMWKLTLTATEMQAALIVVTIIDTATKAVEDQMILINTYGNASAQHEFDIDTAVPTVTVNAIASGAITATAIASDAITAAKIATGAITNAKFASGAIDAAAIAADAIGASELAADAIAEIADAVWDEAVAGHATASTFGQALTSVRSNTAQAGAAGSITLDASASSTNDYYKGMLIYLAGGTAIGQARVITGYNGTTKVATIQPNWITNPDSSTLYTITRYAGAVVVADSITAIVTSVWDALTSALTTASSIGKLLIDNINATISSRATQTSVDTVDDFLDTEIAAIKAKTDNLPVDPADASDIASSFSTVNSTLATISGYLDTEIAAILAAVDTEVAAIKAKTDNLPTDPADESSIQASIAALNNISVADVLAGTIEGSFDMQETLKLMLAVLAGKSSGGGTTSIVFRDTADTKDRIAATVDGDGNRTAVTLDAS